MKHIQPVVLAVIRKSNTYLFTLRVDSHPQMQKWQIPGGGLEFGESPQETLHREVKEELGIKVTIITPLPYFGSTVRSSWHGIILPFLCSMKNANDPIILNEEANAFRWFPFNALNSLPLLEQSERVIAEAEKIPSL